MSASSSSSHRQVSSRQRVRSVAARLKGVRPEDGWNWGMLFLLPLWVFAAFLSVSFLVGGLLQLLDVFGLSPEKYLRPTVVQTGVAMLVYVLTIAVVIGIPHLLKQQRVGWHTLGLQRLPEWKDIGLATVTYVAYLLLLIGVFALITQFLPGFPLDQTQDVGFQAFGSRTDNILAFLTLVVLSPIAEETLFRGYLYGKLKTYVPVVFAAIVTSLLFALVHFQWNVGVDVFILSMFLCGLRSLTGSIWAGVLVHMIKNGVAYYILFVTPLIGG